MHNENIPSSFFPPPLLFLRRNASLINYILGYYFQRLAIYLLFAQQKICRKRWCTRSSLLLDGYSRRIYCSSRMKKEKTIEIFEKLVRKINKSLLIIDWFKIVAIVWNNFFSIGWKFISFIIITNLNASSAKKYIYSFVSRDIFYFENNYNCNYDVLFNITIINGKEKWQILNVEIISIHQFQNSILKRILDFFSRCCHSINII